MSIHIGGCAGVSVKKYYLNKFEEGDVVYFVPKARRGILEPHAIREVMIKPVNGNEIWPIFLYKDSLNAYFNENELCNRTVATQLADAYLAAKAAHAALTNSCP